MHILKIIHGYPPEYNAGSEVYSQSVCNEFSKTHKVSVFTREENPYARDFSIRTRKDNDNLTVYITNNPQGKDGYRHKQMDEAFALLIDKLNPDVAYIGHLNHLSTGIIDVLKSKNIPIVFMLHDYWLMCPRGQFLTRNIGMDNNFQVCDQQSDKVCAQNCYSVYFSGYENDHTNDLNAWKSWIHRRMIETKAIVDKVDFFIAPARYLMNRFVKDFGIPKNKITYMDYGFPLDYLKAISKNPKKKEYTFGYIGTHIPAKGVNQLIEAFIKIKKPCKLKIFGRNNGQSTNALKKMTERSVNAIEFCGEYINSELTEKVFANVDSIIVPSIWAENSPLVIHEAQECKVPVITADYGGMAEYVHHRVNGLLFHHRDVNSLHQQMEWALDNQDKMIEFGNRGYIHSKDGHVPSITNHCQNLTEIFNNVIKHHQ